MDIINIFIFFIFGTIIGSFINVFALRYNTGKSFVSGRSQCFSCGKILEPYELIPLFSFLFLKGRCKSCKSKISKQYFIIELITGLLFSAIFLKFGLTPYLPLYLIETSLLIAIAIYDFKHKIIPDGMVWIFNSIALLTLLLLYGFSGVLFQNGLLDLLSGPILFSFFAFLWLVSRGRWMGFGDAKLALGVGWLLGMSGGIFAILLAFWIGAIWSITILILQSLKISRLGLTIKSEIPFAPFIIIGFFLQFLTGWTMMSLILYFN